MAISSDSEPEFTGFASGDRMDVGPRPVPVSHQHFVEHSSLKKPNA